MTEFKVKNPAFREHIREKLLRQHFMHHLGIGLSKIEAGYIEAELANTDVLQQQNAFLHGGVTATLCDVSAGFAAYSLVDMDEGVVTGDLRISYLNPGDAPNYLAKGWVIKTGKLLNFCESEVWGIYPDKDPVLVAKSSSTMVTVKMRAIEKQG